MKTANSKLYHKFIEEIDNGVIILDNELNIVDWNRWVTLFTKRNKDDFLDKKIHEVFPEIDEKKLKRKIYSSLKLDTTTYYFLSDSGYFIKIPISKVSNPLFEHMQQKITIVPIDLDNKLVIINIKDETHQKETDQKLQSFQRLEEENKKLLTDPLTNLSNRSKLLQDIKLSAEEMALCLINIDDFKDINDFFGTKVGDELLKSIGAWLKRSIDNSYLKDVVNLYKFTGDEYAILLLTDHYYDEFLDFVNDLCENVHQNAFFIDEREIMVSLSCGISRDRETILKKSDLALKVAKRRKGSIIEFSQEYDTEDLYHENMLWLKRLRKAIDEKRLITFFQPLINNKTKKIEKFESLIRMRDKKGKIISPFFFLEISKKVNLYHKITHTVIEQSFEMFDNTEYEFSINLSVRDILNKETVDLLYKKMDENPHIAKRVVFEILESEGIENFNKITEFIDNVKKKGAKIAIDDFGTGYSNFEYISQLKVDYLKIDGSLIKSINKKEDMFHIVHTINQFCKKLNIKTIAEYVSDEDIFEIINDLEINYSQGFYFSPPVENPHLLELEIH